MADRGEIRVKLYSSALVERTIGTQGHLRAVSASGRGYTGAVGNGTVTIPISEMAELSDPSYPYILPYDIATVYVKYGDGANDTSRICSFVIRNIKLQSSNNPGQPSYFKLSGPDMLYYLSRTVNTVNIGKMYTGEALATGAGRDYVYVPFGNLEDEGLYGDEPSPNWPVFWPKWNARKATSSDQGATFVEVDEVWEDGKPANGGGAPWAIGDPIGICYNFTILQTHWTRITDIQNDPGNSYYQLSIADPLPKKARRLENDGPRYYPIHSPHIFKGDPIRIATSAGDFLTRVSGDAFHSLIPLEEHLPGGVANEATITWWSHRELNTINDISSITAPVAGWSLTGSVSSGGSAHLVEMNTTLSLLEATQEGNPGDYFYVKQDDPKVPEKHLVWIQQASTPSSGITLVSPTQAGMRAAVASSTQCIIHSIARDTKDFPLSAIIPVGGSTSGEENKWNLGDADMTAAEALEQYYGITDGPTITVTYTNANYRVNNTGSTISATERVDFNHITPVSNNSWGYTDAANRLLGEAALFLYNRQAARHEYKIETVLPDGVEIYQGMTVAIDYTDNEWDIDISDNTIFIADYEHRISATGPLAGQRVTMLTISKDGPFMRETGATIVANAIRKGLGGGKTVTGTGGGLVTEPPPAGEAPHPEVVIESSTPAGALTIDGQELTFLMTAGDGLVFLATELNVEIGANSGLEFDGLNKLAMGTPTTLDADTTNALTTASHAHAVDAEFDAFSTPGTLLKSNPSGRLSVSNLGVGKTFANGALDVGGAVYIDGDINFVGQQSIYTDTGDLQLQPANDLTAMPQTGTFYIGKSGTDVDMTSWNWVSGSLGTGWGITSEGRADFRQGYFEELHVTTFTIEQARVKTGVEMITQSGTFVSRDFAIPAVGASGTLYVEDAPGLPNIPVFGTNDYVFIQVVDFSSGAAVIANIWGQVTGHNTLTGNEQSWTFITRSLGVGSAGLTAVAGAPVIDMGQWGDGWVTLNAIDQMGAPYVGLGRWHTNPYTASNREHPARFGDLGGVTGDRGLMGLFIGRKGGRRIIASEAAIEAHGMKMSMYKDSRVSTGYIRVEAVEVNVDYGAAWTSMRPSADVKTGTDAEGKPWTDNISYSSGSTGYTLIRDDPDSGGGTDYIVNTLYTSSGVHNAVATFDLDNINPAFSETQEIHIKVAGYVFPGTNTRMRLVAEIQDNTGPDYAPHTREALIIDQGTSGDFKVTVGVKPLEILSESDWNGARLRLHWYIVPDGNDTEVIRLDPNYPSIAVGDQLPVAFDSATSPVGQNGFWAGIDPSDGLAKMQIGEGGGQGLFWNGTKLELHNAAGNAVITLNSTGDSAFTGLMLIDTSGEIRQGIGTWGSSFSGLSIRNVSGAGRMSLYSAGPEVVRIDKEGITLEASAGKFSSGSLDWKDNMSTRRFSIGTLVDLGGTVGTYIDSDFTLDIYAAGVSFHSEDPSPVSYGYIGHDTKFTGGLIVGGATASVDDGTLILDQLTGDNPILIFKSTDMTEGQAHGFGTNNTYAQFSKVVSTTGGLFINGAGEENHGIWLRGSGGTVDTSNASVSSQAPIMLQGMLDDAYAGDTANVLAVRAGGSTRMVMKGTGALYMDLTVSQNAYDEYDDMSLVRAISDKNDKGFVQSRWDDFVEHSREDLVALDIVNENGFVNQQNLMKLYAGALWQAHQRISELEERLDGYDNI